MWATLRVYHTRLSFSMAANDKSVGRSHVGTQSCLLIVTIFGLNRPTTQINVYVKNI